MECKTDEKTQRVPVSIRSFRLEHNEVQYYSTYWYTAGVQAPNLTDVISHSEWSEQCVCIRFYLEMNADLQIKRTVDTNSVDEKTSPRDEENVEDSNGVGASQKRLVSRRHIKPVTHKHRMQYCLKFVGLPLGIILIITFASYVLLFGWPWGE